MTYLGGSTIFENQSREMNLGLLSQWLGISGRFWEFTQVEDFNNKSLQL